MTSYTESVNPEICEKLSKMTFSQFQILFSKSTTKRHDDYDTKKEYDKVIKYCKEQKKHNYKLKVNYCQSMRIDDDKIGRMIGYGPCMQRLYNGIRGVLMNGITLDADMKLAHPSLLYKLCIDNDISAPSLYKYISSREEIIEDLGKTDGLTKAEVKNLFNKSINKEELTYKHNNKKIKNKFFLEFDAEVKMIQKEIITLYPQYLAVLEDKNKEYNEIGSAINYILCDKENEILQKALRFIRNETDHKISVLMFDGFMIEPNNINEVDKQKLIKQLNKVTKEDMIKWDIKEHNIELLELINEMEFIEIDSYMASDIISLTNHIIEGKLKDKIYRCNDNLYLITQEKILSNEKTINCELYKIISNNDYHFGPTEDKDGNPLPIAGKYHKTIKEIIECIKNRCPINNNFLKEVWSDTLGKIYFNNGYYDFDKSKFVKGKYNKSFIKIEYDYSDVIEEKYYTEVYNKLLNPVFCVDDNLGEAKKKTQTELLNHFLYKISRIMAGKIEDKEWILLEGMRDCGKGAICDLLKNSFEGYVKATNSGNFVYKASTTDSAKSQSWMIDYEFIRAAIASETSAITHDGSIIKKFSSGGDWIEARKNTKDEREFKMQCGLILCCNDLPKIEPKDALEKCVEYQLKAKFINDEFPESEKIEGFSYYKKDDEFKASFSCRKEIILAFTNIIIKAFNNKQKYPEELKKINDSNKEESDYTRLFNLFEITNDKKDIIFNKKLEDILKLNKIPFSVKKTRPLLIAKGANEHRISTSKGLCNIKLREQLDENEKDCMEETN
jgi:hypothetical protein